MTKNIDKKEFLPSFAKRGSRPISQRRQQLFEELLPKIEIDPKNIPASADIFTDKKQQIWLEIGFGGGEHIAQQAEVNSDIGFIGSEVFEKGISSFLRHADEKNLNNVRLFLDDARILLETLPDNYLDRIFVLFPDPWPKKKHHKRRLISPETVALFARVIKPGGVLRIATDHMPYARWVLATISEDSGFSWTAKRVTDWTKPPQDHFTTRYEIKRKTGDQPVFLDFVKE